MFGDQSPRVSGRPRFRDRASWPTHWPAPRVQRRSDAHVRASSDTIEEASHPRARPQAPHELLFAGVAIPKSSTPLVRSRRRNKPAMRQGPHASRRAIPSGCCGSRSTRGVRGFESPANPSAVLRSSAGSCARVRRGRTGSRAPGRRLPSQPSSRADASCHSSRPPPPSAPLFRHLDPEPATDFTLLESSRAITRIAIHEYSANAGIQFVRRAMTGSAHASLSDRSQDAYGVPKLDHEPRRSPAPFDRRVRQRSGQPMPSAHSSDDRFHHNVSLRAVLMRRGNTIPRRPDRADEG